MDREIRKLCRAINRKKKIKSIPGLIRAVSTLMFHIDQERDIRGTIKESKKPDEIRIYRDVQKEIEGHSLIDYLSRGVDSSLERIPCSCSQMAEVSAHLAAELTGKEINIIRRVNPLYIKSDETHREHSLNSFESRSGLVYFDSSVYKRVSNLLGLEIDGKIPKSVTTKLASKKGFVISNIDFNRFIRWDRWLQSGRADKSGHPKQDFFRGKHLSSDYFYIINP